MEAPEVRWWPRVALFLGSQALSVVGTGMTFFACTVWVSTVLYPAPEQKAQLALALTALAAALALPRVALAAVGGALADRVSRRRILVAMNGFGGLLSLTLLVLMQREWLTLWSLVLLAALFGTVEILHRAAAASSMVLLAPREHLARVNGIDETLNALAAVVAPLAAGALISLPELGRRFGVAWLGELRSGLPIAVAGDAVSYLLAAGLLAGLSIPRPPLAAHSQGAPSPVRAEGEVLRLLRRTPAFFWLLAVAGAAFFCSSPLHLLQPLLVKFNLSSAGLRFESTLALVQGLAAAGGVAGGLLMSAWGGARRRKVLVLLLVIALEGLAVLVFGASSHLLLACAASFVWGMATPFNNAQEMALWQTLIPPGLQGRVLSARIAVTQLCGSLGVLGAGSLAALVPPGWVAMGMGGFLLLFALSQLLNRPLLRLELLDDSSESTGTLEAR